LSHRGWQKSHDLNPVAELCPMKSGPTIESAASRSFGRPDNLAALALCVRD
jgi:hypothetical protein